jgi:hypothetical protein
MISKIHLKNTNMNEYKVYVDLIGNLEKTLETSNFTVFDIDSNNKEFPKNIKLETRAHLKEPNKINIHHYRCHIHIIADPNVNNTVNGTHLEISFTLSHRFKAEKGSNKHSHIYMALSYDRENKKIIYDGYRKKNGFSKKILENTNAYELSEFLLYENYMRMINEDFDLIEQPISEKNIFDKSLEIYNIKSNKNFKKSFFLLRDNIFWSKLIKYSVVQLFNVLDNLFKLNINKFFEDPEFKPINYSSFTDLINSIKTKHFPDEISTIPPHNKIKQFLWTSESIINFDYEFKNFVEEVVWIYNNYFTNSQLLNKIKLIDNTNERNNMTNTENYYNNLFKVIITQLIPEYITINKSKITTNFNEVRIHYHEIVKKIIETIQSTKDKLLNSKVENEKTRLQIIYDILINIKSKIFICEFMKDELQEIHRLINLFNY